MLDWPTTLNDNIMSKRLLSALAVGAVFTLSVLPFVNAEQLENGTEKNSRNATSLKTDCSQIEQQCYDMRTACFDNGGDAELCDPVYDGCMEKAGC